MGIRSAYNPNEIEKLIDQGLYQIDLEAYRLLARLGEECVIKIRDRSFADSWIDHTGNLRSSIGYVIVHQGSVVKTSGFVGEEKGKSTGKEYAEELAKNHPYGYTLIIVAGMHYAVYVEAKENKDVLASGELYAKKRLPQMIKKLLSQLKK